MKEPAMPIKIVIIQPLGSFPGMSNFAMAPTQPLVVHAIVASDETDENGGNNSHRCQVSNPGHLLDVRIFPRPGKEIFDLRNGASSISFRATKSSL